MVSQLNQFDGISRMYDLLAHLMFAGRVKKSQLAFLDAIPTNANVLILGGGTGWIIDSVKRAASQSTICYIEASQKMILTAKRKYDSSNVEFIHGTEKNIPASRSFDVVITNYFLDLFSTHELQTTIEKIAPSLSENGVWIVADFIDTRWWHCAYLRVMYTFFRTTCALKTTKLPEWKDVLAQVGFEQRAKKRFFHGFIEATVFEMKTK